MSVSSEPEYETSVKNRWRVSVWKNAAKRMMAAGISPRRAVCLYLPGPKDLDRKAAVRHAGFMPYNLIGCDRSESITKKNRNSKNGKFCVNADLVDVLNAWPEKVPLNFVNADLCCGFDTTCAFMADWLLRVGCRQRHPLTLCVNLQRGRDNFSNGLRQIIGENLNGLQIARADKNLRRGYAKNHWIFLNHVNDWHEAMVQDGTRMAAMHRGLHFAVFLERLLDEIDIMYSISLGSYRASNVWMDSVMINVPFIGNKKVTLKGGQMITPIGKKKNGVARKIAATMAHRTMFLNRAGIAA